ncbi:MAG: sodium:solute symporter family transporter [Limisphaerales bacterium]
MTIPDYLTLALYVAGVFAISVVAARRTASQKDMFAAGRQSPWWASGLSGFMTMFSANTFVVWGGIAYELGFVAVMINTCYGIAALLIGYFVAGYWNKLGVATPAEFVQLRFGTAGLHFFTWTMLLKRILGVAASLYALALLLVTLMPMDLTWAIIIFGAIVVIYTMMGGLWAVLMTDVLQFIVLTVVVFLTAVLMLLGTESFTAYKQSVPEKFFDLTAGGYGWFFLLGWVIIHFFMIGAEWAFVQRFIAVRNPGEAHKSSYLFGVMYLVTPLFWLLPPLLYRGQVGDLNKEEAYILAAQSVLPTGVLGLMVAALFSATASMVSSQLNVFAGVLTNDFYRALFHPGASEKTLVRVGRMFTALLGALLVFMAIMVPKMGGAEKLIVSINSLLVVPLFAPTLWGLFSRKIGLREMIIVALTSFFVGLALRFGIASNPMITESHSLWEFAGSLKENKKNVEVLVGVILPVLMLIAIEALKAGADSRAADLARHVAKAESDRQPDTAPFDPFPGRMVMISLYVLGAWMCSIGLWGSQDRTTLFVFAGVLVALGVIVQLIIRQIQTSRANDGRTSQSGL